MSALILAVLLLVAAVAARLFLTGLAFDAVLKHAGASEIRFEVTQASLWQVVMKDVGFLLDLQPFTAERVSLERAHWWTPSLGSLRVESARVPIRLHDPARSPAPERKPAGAVILPFEEISIDGQVVIQADGQADQALTVTIEARPGPGKIWAGSARVSAPGLAGRGEGTYDLASEALVFRVPELALDLKPWAAFAQQVLPLPENDWTVEGQVSGSLEGRWADGALTGTGRVSWRDGRATSTKQAITATGIEADLELSDLAQLVGKAGTVRIREVQTGKLTLSALAADFTMAGMDHLTVNHATLETLGGRVTAEPFRLVPSQAELDAVFRVEGIQVEQVMALTESLPAKATGRVNGRVPVRLTKEGLRLGTGWLGLMPGVQAEIEFNAKGLLTGGASAGTPTFAVLQKIESGLLRLRISELRLDIRPTDAPEGRSAQLHLKGEPVDREVKAPVILDLNVNGPLEKLINLGMDSRLSVGTKP
ncbi:Dicarboxylate transport [Lacunisphaera limnophila]|uniref:Dicarboxylate transport n=2 Tax=Lacunisphaera limnophila TaxID=1838286 RepID=A0A1D8AXQ6_9BACT|nr:Dicarboxylate transport [Lacunisphaera limnophila]